MNTLYLVRHGENLANLTKEFSCRKIDYPLTPKGRLQAQQTAEFFRDRQIGAVYSSPLKRAHESASIIAATLDLPLTVMENFRELAVGELEDMGGSEESWRIHFEVIRAWMKGDFDRCYPGGENYWTARQRMREGIEQILAGESGRDLVVVGHGGLFITTIQDLCPGADFEAIRRQDTHNCAITEIKMQARDGRWVGELVHWADYSHLHGEAAQVVSGLPDRK